jgi:hypothetical protein
VTEQPTGAIVGSIHDVDAQRARWVRRRQFHGMVLDADPDDGEQFAQTGLGRYADQLDVRLLFLPGDPESDAVPLDQETLAWLKEPRGLLPEAIPRRDLWREPPAVPSSSTTSTAKTEAGPGTWRCIVMAASRLVNGA